METTVTIETTSDDEIPVVEPVITEPVSEEPVPVVEPEISEPEHPDLLAQLNQVRETTAAALDEIGEDIGDLQEVVAALVSGMDSVVDYLRSLYESESEEGHTDIPPPVEPEQKAKKAQKEQQDVEPRPRHRYRTAILGRSGGMFR